MPAIHTSLMRGGTSRGPVLLANALPFDPVQRDEAVLKLVGGGTVQTDAVGGGSPTTSKLVVVAPQQDSEGVFLDYAVGNVVVGHNQVDWTGTCGNMTATVALFALEEGIIDIEAAASVRLRNMSTNGMVRARVMAAEAHQRGAEARIITDYLSPGGSVFESVLPTGAASETVVVEGVSYQASLVDVTHPYLFLLYDEVVGQNDLQAADTLAHIERIRAEVCVRLGVADNPHEAATRAPSVPRVILVRGADQTTGGISIHAISMGKPIHSVPVTAGICMAAAAQLPGTIPARYASKQQSQDSLTVVAPSSSLTAFASVDDSGHILSAGVERTARTIMHGEAWV